MVNTIRIIIIAALVFFSMDVLPAITTSWWHVGDMTHHVVSGLWSLLYYFFTETMQGGLVILGVFCLILTLFFVCIGKFFAKLARDPKNSKIERKVYSAIATALEADRW